MPPASRRLLVEGNDDFHLIAHIIDFNKFLDPSIVEDPNNLKIYGADSIIKILPTLLKLSDTTHLGIVLDADDKIAGRWDSIRRLLKDSGASNLPDAPAPQGTITTTATGLRFGLWIMPNNQGEGMLEDFYHSLIPDADWLIGHAETAVASIPSKYRNFSEPHKMKALVHTWLAWQKIPGTPFGLSIKRGYVPGDHPNVRDLIAWLALLFGVPNPFEAPVAADLLVSA